MSLQKLTPFMLLVVAVLLAANLVRPLVAPQTAHAESHEGSDMALSGTGANAWLVKGNTVYYLKWENQFESIRIHGPEEIEE
jgi:hypothetical protein